MGKIKGNKNKIRHYVDELTNLIQPYKVKSGKEYKKLPHTHTSFTGGKWNLPEGIMSDFYRLYNKLRGLGYDGLHMLEKQRSVGPVLIDIDFKVPGKLENKCYTTNNIKKVIKAYNNIVKRYVKVSDEQLTAFVFEKPEPVYNAAKNESSGGIHIMYANLPMRKEIRTVTMDELKDTVEKKGIFNSVMYLKKKNKAGEEIDDSIDMSVAHRNNWFLYGSRKKDGVPYDLTKIYEPLECIEGEIDTVDISEYKDEDLPRFLSIRKYDDNDTVKLIDSVSRHDIEIRFQNLISTRKSSNRSTSSVYSVRSKKSIYSTKSIATKITSSLKDDDPVIIKAKFLVSLLDHSRADNYVDWYQLGRCLNNISYSLFDVWIAFSKLNKKKWNDNAKNGMNPEEYCQKLWERFNDGLTIRTLRMWASNDSPDKYGEMIRERISEELSAAETGSHYKIAKMVYSMYKDTYVCSNSEKGIWWVYKNHRWKSLPENVALSTILSEDITNEFFNLLSYRSHQARKLKKGHERDNAIKKISAGTKVIQKLQDNRFKAHVMKECRVLFYKEEFESKLNENLDILGFGNGVIDLSCENSKGKKGCFRDGTPDDYVSFSAGYDYKEFSFNHPHVKDIELFFGTLHKNPAMKRYILLLISSYLRGGNKDQKFIIWTGGGSNGKSTCIDLIRTTMGEYFQPLPITILTRKRGGADNASPQMAKMKGVRFAVFNEGEHDDTIYVGLMKELSGGDPQTARKLYGEPFQFIPQFKMVLTCNRLPLIPSTDHGTWRRIRVAPWETQFVDEDEISGDLEENQAFKDYTLASKLSQWHQAFMWLLVNKYYPMYLEKGLQEPNIVKKYTDKYRQDSDMFLEFISDNYKVVKDKKKKESLKAMYEALRTWYKSSRSTGSPPTLKQLKEYLNNHEKEYDFDGRGMIRGIVSLDAVDDDDDMPDELE